MKKLIIDTNIYDSKGLNFDINNIIVKVLVDCAKKNKFEYLNLSVIDNEILSHLKVRGEESEKSLKKSYKWITKYINESEIYNNCFKDLIDYEKFKNNIKAINCDFSKINPEIVLKKYFNMELPFEKKESKKHEFPDAFIAEYVNNLAKCNESDEVIFISRDNGLLKSLSTDITKYSTIEEFLKDLNGIDVNKYSFINDLITNNLTEICGNILSNLELDIKFIEEEEIEPTGVILDKMFDFDVIDVSENIISISCIFRELHLNGNFTCLDYDNSYWPNDEDYYTYMEYIKSDDIKYENVNIEFEIVKNDEEYLIKYNNKYTLDIDYNIVKENATEHFSAYEDVEFEASFAQDNGER